MDTTLVNLLSKQGQMVIALGHDLIMREPGDRIPTVQEYAKRNNASIGTTQSAQAYLQQQGIASFESRGHQGTYLTGLKRDELWRLIHPRNIVGAMPLPYSARYEGIATALSEVFEQAEIPLNLVYIRGANSRLQTLREDRADFVVISALAAEQAYQDSDDISILMNLGTETYVSKHVLVFREAGHEDIEDGMRVGIDRQSLDQSHFTYRVCEGKQVEMVEVGYMQIPVALQRGLIDATIWNRDELHNYNELHVVESREVEANSTNTEACIVTRKDATALTHLLGEFLQVERIQQIQQDVLSGALIPRY